MELQNPVTLRRLGDHYQMRAHDLFLLAQEGQESDCLDGFAQSHFVRKDAIDPSFVETNESVDSADLIVPQLSTT